MLDERMKKHPGFIAFWGSTKKDSNTENKEDLDASKEDKKPEK